MSLVLTFLFLLLLLDGFACFLLQQQPVAERGSQATGLFTLLGGAVLLLATLISLAWLLSLAGVWSQPFLIFSLAIIYILVRWFMISPAGLPVPAPGTTVLGYLARLKTLSPLERACVSFMFLVLAFNLFRGLILPPLNIDSLYCHLARVNGWFFADRIVTVDSPIPLTNVYPPTVHIIQSSLLKLVGNDSALESVAALSYALLFATTVGIFRALGFHRPAAACASLATLAMPILATLAVTTQVDLPSLLFLALSLYTLIHCQQRGHRWDYALFGLSLGLLVTSKPQGIVLGGTLVVWTVGMVLAGRFRFRGCLVAALLTFLLVAPPYLFNWVTTGAFFDPHPDAAGFSFAKLTGNLFTDYPTIVFLFPLRLTAQAYGTTYSWFDHDESNFGFLLPLLLIGVVVFVGIKTWRRFRPPASAQRPPVANATGPSPIVELRLLGVVLAVFILFMASQWRQDYYRWDVRSLIYGAFVATILGFVILRRFFASRIMQVTLVTYGIILISIVSLCDARSGLRTLLIAAKLRPEQRTFANLSPYDCYPSKAIQQRLNESSLRDGPIAIFEPAVRNICVAAVAGIGPARPVYYTKLADDDPRSGYANLYRLMHEVSLHHCKWVFLDAKLANIRAALDGNHESFQLIVSVAANGALYHVNDPLSLGFVEPQPDISTEAFELNSRGWYGIESFPSDGKPTATRWMSANDATLTWAAVPPTKHILSLKLVYVGPRALAYTDRITAFLNGSSLGTKLISEAAGGSLSWDVPAAALDSTNVVRFQGVSTYVPPDGAKERRRLLLFVQAVSLTAAELPRH